MTDETIALLADAHAALITARDACDHTQTAERRRYDDAATYLRLAVPALKPLRPTRESR